MPKGLHSKHQLCYIFWCQFDPYQLHWCQIFHVLESRDGAVVRALASHGCDLGLISSLDAMCGLSLLLVPFSALRGFSPGTPTFPSHQKPIFPNCNLIQIQWTNSPSMGGGHCKFPLLLLCFTFPLTQHQICFRN